MVKYYWISRKRHKEKIYDVSYILYQEEKIND